MPTTTRTLTSEEIRSLHDIVIREEAARTIDSMNERIVQTINEASLRQSAELLRAQSEQAPPNTVWSTQYQQSTPLRTRTLGEQTFIDEGIATEPASFDPWLMPRPFDAADEASSYEVPKQDYRMDLSQLPSKAIEIIQEVCEEYNEVFDITLEAFLKIIPDEKEKQAHKEAFLKSTYFMDSNFDEAFGLKSDYKDTFTHILRLKNDKYTDVLLNWFKLLRKERVVQGLNSNQIIIFQTKLPITESRKKNKTLSVGIILNDRAPPEVNSNKHGQYTYQGSWYDVYSGRYWIPHDCWIWVPISLKPEVYSDKAFFSMDAIFSWVNHAAKCKRAISYGCFNDVMQALNKQYLRQQLGHTHASILDNNPQRFVSRFNALMTSVFKGGKGSKHQLVNAEFQLLTEQERQARAESPVRIQGWERLDLPNNQIRQPVRASSRRDNRPPE